MAKIKVRPYQVIGEGNNNPLQYSCLENSMDRGAWRATVHGVANRQTEVSNSHTHTHTQAPPSDANDVGLRNSYTLR